MIGRRVRIIKPDHRYEGHEGVIRRKSQNDFKVPGGDELCTWWLVDLDPMAPNEALTAFVPGTWLTLVGEEAAA